MNDFWDFAVGVYRKPGVEAGCLALQDRFGLDVNVILFCLWLGAGRHELRHNVLDDAMAVSDQWQAVITPIRMARRTLKGFADASTVTTLRERMKAVELEAERCESSALARLWESAPLLPTAGTPRDVARSNLEQYFSAQNLAADLLGSAEVLRILHAAFAVEAG